GEPLRLPLVAELDNAVAVAFDPETDGFFVAEGGSGAALVNRVRQFDRDGKPTGWTLGRGGNAQGIWSPDAFAFSEGSGDIVVAQDGSLWVNPGWRHKLYRAFRSLSHFTRDGEYTHTIMGVASFSGIAADRDLSVYIGGQVKVDIENRPVWTSGLVRSGSGDGFPSTHVDFWPTAPVMVGRRLFIYGEADGSLFELDPATGRCDREPGAFYKVPAKSALAGSDDALYCLKKDDSRIYRVPLELRGELEPIADLAEPPVNDARLAVSADGSLACVRRGETLTAYQLPDGKTLWTRPARGGVVVLGDMVVTGAPGTGHAGLQVLDAGGGTKLCMIGDRKIRGVAPFPVGAPIAGVSTDDGHYLFVEAGGGIPVLKLAHHTAENVTPPNVPVEPRPEEDGNAK
ncbi:MAG: hypothetical protein CMJ85_06270, partial [Planctomycetes bacterium]|nr:hypothetical protein [Planctomycetota bacterium]